LSVSMKQPRSHWMDFYEIWYLCVFLKSVKKIQASLKSYKSDGYCTWSPLYILYHISFSSS